ncbi:MAG: hypothetical protein Q4P84_08815 [Elusimicrobiales bacterium]|nr:hypothetical protein [Elusimicrobiales bacterium]
MQKLLKCRMRMWFRRRVPSPADGAAQSRAAFARRYQEVCAACLLLEPGSQIPASKLAADYMTGVLNGEPSAEWWRTNEIYCAQPWFIWEYCLSRGLVSPPEPAAPENPYHVIHPPSQDHGGVALIRLSRDALLPGEGILCVEANSADDGLAALLRAQGLRPMGERFLRKIGERAAPLFDRAVQVACALLEGGYAVGVTEPALKSAILSGQYAPEHLYWVLPLSQPERLRLVYPHNPRLHDYICQAGGRWNGQYTEISIVHADRLEDLMRVYDFRATKEARRRLDAWQEAVRQASIYRSRHRADHKRELTREDLFRRILLRPAAVIEDLRETDD